VFKHKEAKAGQKESKVAPRRRLERREAPRKSAKSGSRLIRYFQDTGEELRKVSWPSRETAVRLTLLVLGTTLFFAVVLGALDVLFQRLAALLVAF